MSEQGEALLCHVRDFEVSEKTLLTFKDHVDVLFAKETDFDSPEQHALIGISTELGELSDAFKKHKAYGERFDVDNVLEELGDIIFYIFSLSQRIEHPSILNPQTIKRELASVANDNIKVDAIGVALRLAEISLGSLNASVRLETPHINYLLTRMFVTVILLGLHLDILIDDIFQHNIAKLKVRYPNGFSPEHAVRRMDKDSRIS